MHSFKQHITNSVVQEAITYHSNNSIPIDCCIFRYGSEMYFEFYNTLRDLHNIGLLESFFPNLSQDELELLDSDLGTVVEFFDESHSTQPHQVYLDYIYEDSALNVPKRGGDKKFYVYVRDPETKNIKKVSFGDTTGLTVKYNNPERKKAFASRHNCADKTDKTTPGYWSCRINKYMGKTPQARRGYW